MHKNNNINRPKKNYEQNEILGDNVRQHWCHI
jgi:hypothetical protein